MCIYLLAKFAHTMHAHMQIDTDSGFVVCMLRRHSSYVVFAVDLIPLLSESMTGVALSMIIVCVSSAMANCSQVSSAGTQC